MPNTREKLIELLETVVSPKEVLCDGEVLVSTARVADHLIANGVTIGGSDLIAEVITDRIICDQEGKYHHQFRFKLGDRDLGISKELPEELVALAMMEQQWIPVTERLPEDTMRVLVRSLSGWIGAEPYIKGKGFEQCGAWIPVTHWMPLPEPPKGE